MSKVAVSISTTGDGHRMPFLKQCVAGWDAALDTGDSLFVTVDGTDVDAAYVRDEVSEWTASVYRVGQRKWGAGPYGGRLGVAANKNTGLEAIMENTEADRLWLSDDDAWPLAPAALVAHYNLDYGHSMVCWGHHRRAVPIITDRGPGYSSWSWPRGSVLYATRAVVDRVGGMIEAFGTGGHEHVEWSQRIHNAGFTPALYVSPLSYMDDRAYGARWLWHCEDMAKPGESTASLVSRRRHLTTIQRRPEDAAKQDTLMQQMCHADIYIPYHAEENGRLPATLLPIV